MVGECRMLSQRLRQARLASKLTQEELGKKVNTTKSTISNYENGYSTPSTDILIQLAETLQTTTDFLLGRSTANAETQLLTVEQRLVDELKKYPTIYEELTTNPMMKVKELETLYTIRNLLKDGDK